MKLIITRKVLEEAVRLWAIELGYDPNTIVLRHMQTTPIYYHVAQKAVRGENKLSRSMTARELYAWLGN